MGEEKSINSMIMSSAQIDIECSKRCVLENCRLLWIADDIEQSKEDFQNALNQLCSIVNEVHVITNSDECVDLLTQIDDARVFIVLKDTVGLQIVPLIHDVSQLDGIYILSRDESRQAKWCEGWKKIKGLHTQITTISRSLRLIVEQCNRDSIAISVIPVDEETSTQNVDQLEPSFMYTRIFKDIFLEMEHGDTSIKDLVLKLSEICHTNPVQQKMVEEFARDYRPDRSIWWYTRATFIYETLNRALRMLDVDILVTSGFFLRDLNEQIEQLQKQQIHRYGKQLFSVYRGQGLPQTNFNKLLKSKGGLMSFNNFLSTSRDRAVSLFYAESSAQKTNTVGILFTMSIDPTTSSTPFASINEISYYQDEKEVLFSMHTIFRIEDIKKINGNDQLYQVELQLTGDDDKQLRTLTNYIQNEIGGSGWERMGKLLVMLGQLDKADELYTTLLNQALSESDKALHSNNLGCVKTFQGDPKKAIELYVKALEIREQTSPPNSSALAQLHNNMGAMYINAGKYEEALLSHERALGIWTHALPPDHPNLAISYNSIGAVHHKMGKCSSAIPLIEKAIEIQEKSLPENHPDMATSYANIGVLYSDMAEYKKALSFYRKAVQIQEKSLPENHPDMATSYNKIGHVYSQMGKYSTAVGFHKKAAKVQEESLGENDLSLADSYNNIGYGYLCMQTYSTALTYFRTALDIKVKALSPKDTALATTYNNIGAVCRCNGEYSEALSYYEKALEIRNIALPPNHPDLAVSYNNSGAVHYTMGGYANALSFYEKAVEIWRVALVPNHPSLAVSYINIGGVYASMKEYYKALSFYEKAAEIQQIALAPDHPDLAATYNSIAAMYQYIEDCSNAY